MDDYDAHDVPSTVVADLLDITDRSVRRLAGKGEIPATFDGKAYHFDLMEVIPNHVRGLEEEAVSRNASKWVTREYMRMRDEAAEDSRAFTRYAQTALMALAGLPARVCEALGPDPTGDEVREAIGREAESIASALASETPEWLACALEEDMGA